MPEDTRAILIDNGTKVAKRLADVICDPNTNVAFLADLAIGYEHTARRLMILGKVIGKTEEGAIN